MGAQRSIPQRLTNGRLSITFDDGYLNQYQNAFPVLRKFDLPAVVFVITGLVGRWFEGRSLMDEEHLQELFNSDWEIGSHTISHPHLTQLSPNAVDSELRESKNWGRKRGFPMKSFAYPFGEFNREISKQVARYYPIIRTGLQGLNEPKERQRRPLKVVSMWKSIEKTKLQIDQAIKQDKWLIVSSHGVVTSKRELPKDNYDVFGWITKTELEDFVDSVHSSGIRVSTLCDK